MKINFNEEGFLPYGIHELTLNEVENKFSKNKSQKRQEIFGYYKNHLNEINDTGCCLNHWIDGSYISLKENPNDIDTLTEFDGVKIEELGIKDEIEDLIYNAPLRTNGSCHSLMVFKYPESYGQGYEYYLESKSRILYLLFPKIRNSNNIKGFIKLKGE